MYLSASAVAVSTWGAILSARPFPLPAFWHIINYLCNVCCVLACCRCQRRTWWRSLRNWWSIWTRLRAHTTGMSCCLRSLRSVVSPTTSSSPTLSGMSVRHLFTPSHGTLCCRDAPIIVLLIIRIGRLLCWYRLIVIYYVLWWHWILKLYIFFNLNGRHKFSFYSYICKLGKRAGSVV